MDRHDRITADSEILVGKPIIKGTRIALEFVIDLLARGWTTEQILKEYNHLTPDDVRVYLAYAAAGPASARGPAV